MGPSLGGRDPESCFALSTMNEVENPEVCNLEGVSHHSLVLKTSQLLNCHRNPVSTSYPVYCSILTTIQMTAEELIKNRM